MNKIKLAQLFNAKKHIYHSWLVSYVIILILPLIINMFVYINAYDTIKKQSSTYQETLLAKLKTDMDNELRIIRDFSYKISAIPDIRFFLNATTISDYIKDYDSALRAHALGDSLNLWEPSESLISDYYIFSTGSNLIWHNNGIYELASYSKKNNNLSGELWDRCNQQNLSANLIFSLADKKGSYTVITYPLPYSPEPKGFIAILLDNKTLREYFYKTASLNQSTIYLTDDTKTILAASEKVDNNKVFQNNEDITDSKVLKINHEPQSVYSLSSDVLSFHYICALPLTVASSQLVYLQRSLLISVLFCLIGGGFLIVYLMKRNYSPIKNLMETIQGYSHIVEEQERNELQIVSGALQSIYESKASIEEVVKKQNKTIYSYYLGKLLKGNLDLLTTDEAIVREIEEELLLSNYIVLLTLIDVSPDWTENRQEFVKSAYLAFFETQILYRLRLLLGTEYHITCTEVHDFTACIIGITEKDTSFWQAKLKQALDEISVELSNNHKVQYFFSSSTLHHSITEFESAYQESRTAISYSIMNHQKDIIFWEDIHLKNSGNSYFPIDYQHKLQNMLQSGLKEETYIYINEVLEQVSTSEASFEVAKCVACDIVITIAGLMTGQADGSNNFSKLIEDLMHTASFDKLKQQLYKITDYVAARCGNHTQEMIQNNSWIAKIDTTIKENLYDENLNVMFIANKLGLSTRYISLIYQEKNGVGIIDTIHKQRIEQFKQIILKDNISIQEAAAAVGYSSVATLTRWIKKYEGVTPGQLKNNLQ